MFPKTVYEDSNFTTPSPALVTICPFDFRHPADCEGVPYGFDLNIRLITAAGLLHDIARVEDRHWEVGAELMKKLGYNQEKAGD